MRDAFNVGFTSSGYLASISRPTRFAFANGLKWVSLKPKNGSAIIGI